MGRPALLPASDLVCFLLLGSALLPWGSTPSTYYPRGGGHSITWVRLARWSLES